ncbi:MAG: hypothetical protein LBD41_03110 [Clostridiales Family XIII bacterium]|jgi:hypothetical protein|nr:hypothetical protein [Clostridiales Family XIII bacterium]
MKTFFQILREVKVQEKIYYHGSSFYFEEIKINNLFRSNSPKKESQGFFMTDNLNAALYFADKKGKPGWIYYIKIIEPLNLLDTRYKYKGEIRVPTDNDIKLGSEIDYILKYSNVENSIDLKKYCLKNGYDGAILSDMNASYFQIDISGDTSSQIILYSQDSIKKVKIIKIRDFDEVALEVYKKSNYYKTQISLKDVKKYYLKSSNYFKNEKKEKPPLPPKLKKEFLTSTPFWNLTNFQVMMSAIKFLGLDFENLSYENIEELKYLCPKYDISDWYTLERYLKDGEIIDSYKEFFNNKYD